MKKLTALLLACFIAVSATGCGSGKSDSTDYSQNNNKTPKPVMAELFFESGNKLGEVHFTYDENQNMTSYVMKYTDERSILMDDETHTMTYDENGNLLTEYVQYGDDKPRMVKELEYIDGRIAKEKWNGGGYERFDYDANGHLSAKYYVYSDGTEELNRNVECDDNGRVILEVQIYDDWKIEWVYTYDENGIITNEEYFVNGDLLLSHPYYYENGLLTKQVVSIESFKNEGYLIYHYEN